MTTEATSPITAQASVIIPSFNRRGMLRGIIEPLLTDPATGEVIVVVDGSDDGSLELLLDWAASELRLRPIYQENSGSAVARQHGIEEASFDVVVILDDDVTAGSTLISGHLRWHAGDSRRVVLGYLPTPVPNVRRPGQVATLLYSEDYEHTCQAYEADSEMVTRHFWAGNFSIRRDDALRIGMVSSTRLPYHEDMYFGIRCAHEGIEGVFDRTLIGPHSHRRNLHQFVIECRQSGEGRAIILREFPKHEKDLSPLAVLSHRQAALIRFLASPVTRPVSSWILSTGSRVAGLVRLWNLELFAGRVLRQVELIASFDRTQRQLTAGIAADV